MQGEFSLRVAVKMGLLSGAQVWSRVGENKRLRL